MSSALPFDALTLSIDGTNLIEASAGTGKTYGIAALFTRLIVLEKKDIEKILVVTFTKAATAELKTRLRARLDEVLQVLNEIQTLGGEPEHISDGLNTYYDKEKKSPDDFLNRLIPLALGEQDGQESCHRLILRLKAALSQFDNASIYTIHGFCQRVLRDYAFLCGAPLDVELSDDSRERLLIPAQDFWRQKVATDTTLAQLVFDRKCTPEEMLAEIKSYTGRPYLKFRRPEGSLKEAQANLQETWQKVCGQLEDLEKAFWTILPKLNGQTYKRNTFENVFIDLKTNAESSHLPRLGKQTLGKLNHFSIDTLNSKLKKEYKADADAPEIIQLQALANLGRDLQAMESAEEAVFICLQLDLLSYINQSIAEQKKSRRERVFDDLLLDVHQALTTNEHGNALAKVAAANWEIALIDEFQDTDPLQYEIFRQIFIEQGCPLFLVGDPKQAIYSFRGADIYAYLQAAQDADRHYTLAVNYRSHAKLINGISALFKQKNIHSYWKTSITAMSPPAAPKAGCRHTAPPSKCAGSIRTTKPAKKFCAAVPPNIAPMKLPLRSMKQPKAV
ncbi:UvrD/REP helicase [Neisseria flavescens SK114]|nr:UvrD/REP helicase [Neisseria flavescens SK114]